jgi:branched-subunit amino acid aminotransferase/4-amino-4-deoxychorismate lyase
LSLLSGKPTPGSSPGTVLIQPGEPTEFDPRYFEDGITVLIAQPGANPFDAMAGHKTLAYWSRLRTLRQAASVRGAGAGEAIWLNVSNHLASGAISNLFLVKDGQLLTPIARGEESEKGLPAPVLPGITRAAVIELAEGLGVTVKRQMLSIDDLLDADEVFLTNSSWHILPVSRVEKSPIGQGKAGDLTRRLRTDLLKLIERETSE